MSAKQLKEAFANQKLNSAVVEIDGVGKVLIRELTFGDIEHLDSSGTQDGNARNLALALYSEDGKERIFDPDNQDDVEIIKGLSNRMVNRIAGALQVKN
ncbi:hypothetical protein G9Q38_07240 [Pusillimonas sp. DMV24BSW_D]|uniref:hypothetical protein n=1 Tax=Neopusillimonas aestuarii TaxID=2716226 RepID=UPI00140AAA19|nr:hypothetical protein [Pusillimonas sp. DMV24BSW_D]QIM48990.1 hypothetical protein G9Q38_07240 [Pusillimonas sp. DMV24BSW_D]